MKRIDPKWECGECGEVHGDEDDARDCCKPSVREVYLCPACDCKFNTEDRALDCCAEEAAESGAGGPTAAELEAQGQMRLNLDQGPRP